MFQSAQVSLDDSDCGTKAEREVLIDSKNIQDIIFRNVISGNKMVEINDDNQNEFIGKTVKIRTPLACKQTGKVCSKCTGSLFKILEIENAGNVTTKVSQNILRASMKKFHTSEIKVNEINLETLFL